MFIVARRGPVIVTKSTVIVGTSGSTDYLRDADPDQYRPTRQDRRFWPVSVPRGAPVSDDDQGDKQICDGLHDDDAPLQYLCSRCFQDLRGDLAEPQNDEYNEARRDEDEEMK